MKKILISMFVYLIMVFFIGTINISIVKADINSTNASDYKYEYNTDKTTLCITGYYGSDEVLSIPSEINGTEMFEGFYRYIYRGRSAL